MTEILSSPSVFSWSMLGRRSSAAFLLPRPEKGVWWPTPCRAHPVRVAGVALKLTDLVSISRNAATGRATWRHLFSSPTSMCNIVGNFLCLLHTFAHPIDKSLKTETNKSKIFHSFSSLHGQPQNVIQKRSTIFLPIQNLSARRLCLYD